MLLLGFTLLFSSSLVQADDSARAQPQNLSYLSVPMGDIVVNSAESNSVDGFPAEAAAAITKPKKAFSPEQEKLMQDLSKLIVVNSMGFMLALNLKY
jgi:hypothetical protein